MGPFGGFAAQSEMDGGKIDLKHEKSAFLAYMKKRPCSSIITQTHLNHDTYWSNIFVFTSSAQTNKLFGKMCAFVFVSSGGKAGAGTLSSHTATPDGVRPLRGVLRVRQGEKHAQRQERAAPRDLGGGGTRSHATVSPGSCDAATAVCLIIY